MLLAFVQRAELLQAQEMVMHECLLCAEQLDILFLLFVYDGVRQVDHFLLHIGIRVSV